jgi:hypothetical protein
MSNLDTKYKDSKIYVVKCKYDENLIYVGSTITSLAKRYGSHKKNKCCSLYQFVKGDWVNWYIELYEEYPCNDKKSLEKREGEIIRKIGTINKCIAGRTGKEFYYDNKESILQRRKEHYKSNKDKILKIRKDYYQKHKEDILKKRKIYYQRIKSRNILDNDKF